jgi:osmoprotectant transport system substrate-binding protein
MRFIKKAAFVLSIMMLAGAFSGCGAASDNKIVIGSKNFTENMVLGSIFAQLIEAKTDLTVEYKENLGGTMVCFEALKKGQLDIYPEYTGTGLTAQLKGEVINDADEVYRIVREEFDRQFKIKWLRPLGFNNTYAVAVREDYAKENNIAKVSELVPHAGGLVFGAEHEFFDRQDGYDSMIKAYGLRFKGEPVKMDVAMKYQAISQGKMDVTDAFSTDGQLITFKLKVLEDDKNFFPPYYAAPIIKEETLESHPELEDILNLLGDKISDEEMQKMNYQVEAEKKSTRDTAREFLISKGLIEE